MGGSDTCNNSLVRIDSGRVIRVVGHDQGGPEGESKTGSAEEELVLDALYARLGLQLTSLSCADAATRHAV